MSDGSNKMAIITTAPTFIQYLIASLTPVAQTTGAPNPVKHSWVAEGVKALLTTALFAAPIVEAANPASAAAIDLGIKASVALYNAFGWPQGVPAAQPQPATPPAEAPAVAPSPLPPANEPIEASPSA